MFDKILLHLSRKKPKTTYSSTDVPIKPICDVVGHQLSVEYNYYYMTITYLPDKMNHYYVDIEYDLAVFGRARQEFGTRYWVDWWHEQEDVIEYIRYKMR
jgi:hypothetical protein